MILSSNIFIYLFYNVINGKLLVNIGNNSVRLERCYYKSKEERGKIMRLGDLFKVNQFKSEIEQLKANNLQLYNENCDMKNLLTPEMQDTQKPSSFDT